MQQMQMPAQTPHVLYQSAMKEPSDFASFVSKDVDMNSTNKKNNLSRSKSRHGRHNYLVNAYRSKRARRNAGKGKDDLASQMSKMSISKSIRKAPRARSVMHVDPTRVQQTRKVKDCATGIFSEAYLKKR